MAISRQVVDFNIRAEQKYVWLFIFYKHHVFTLSNESMAFAVA